MQQKGTAALDTCRLRLRRFTPEDAEAMYRNWASDPEVTRFLTWPTHPSVDVTKAVVQSWVEQYADPGVYQWAIVPHTVGEPIGSISVVAMEETAQEAEIGYCIGRPWWHQGYAREALHTVLEFLFQEVQVQQITARHDIQNPRSGTVMRHCGMQAAGILPHGGRNNRGIVDVAVYRLQVQDWRAQRECQSHGKPE